MTPEALAQEIRAAAKGRERFVVALAGPPGAGKSTLAEALVAALGAGARLVPMDGFHFDDRVLIARGLAHCKGAPETFDVRGFLNLMERLREGGEIAIPVFDRAMELARAAADVVTDEDRILVVEGNYLLLDEEPWRRLRGFFDLTLFLDVPEAELERRLLARWAARPEGAAWVASNDMPNVRRVIGGSAPADRRIRWP
ncbi:nucleoside/nucleotide kinase family protein [Cereibacter sediminicola]|uniref:nucleoside/nucleotide kinase family protein n=1 Tax=Cereibacter sediminicola TaxID=2584941 RepID=UPI0011A8AC13|nr:nucleoside/nucleotide kinase family protein [Cereibacter sediminicola]